MKKVQLNEYQCKSIRFGVHFCFIITDIGVYSYNKQNKNKCLLTTSISNWNLAFNRIKNINSNPIFTYNPSILGSIIKNQDDEWEAVRAPGYEIDALFKDVYFDFWKLLGLWPHHDGNISRIDKHGNLVPINF